MFVDLTAPSESAVPGAKVSINPDYILSIRPIYSNEITEENPDGEAQLLPGCIIVFPNFDEFIAAEGYMQVRSQIDMAYRRRIMKYYA